MKSTFLTLLTFLFFLLFLVTDAQIPPQSFNYQAVVRDQDFQPIISQAISLKASIILGNPNGIVEYSEIHDVSTNELGLVNLQIGKGTPETNFFDNINWGGDDYFLKIELDPAGGNNYFDMGTTQLVSVPYALYAERATTADLVDDADADPTNELQDLTLNGNILGITLGNSVNLNSISPWVPFNNGIYYNLGEVWVGTGGVAPGLQMAPNFYKILTGNGTLQSELSPGLLQLWNNTGQITALIGGNPGSVGTFINGNLVSQMGANTAFAGVFRLFDPTGNVNVELNSLAGQPSSGYISANTQGNPRVIIEANASDAGLLKTIGPNDLWTTYVGHDFTNPSVGTMSVYRNGNPRATITSSVNDAGDILTFGPTNTNVRLTNLVGQANTGVVEVLNSGNRRGLLTTDMPVDAGILRLFGPTTRNAELTYTTNDHNCGALKLYASGNPHSVLHCDAQSAGSLNLLSPTGNVNVKIGSNLANNLPEKGSIEIMGDNATKISLVAKQTGYGSIHTFGTNGNRNVAIHANSPNTDAGLIQVFNPNDRDVVILGAHPVRGDGFVTATSEGGGEAGIEVNSFGAGEVYTKGPTGSNLSSITNIFDSPITGLLQLFGSSGAPNTMMGVSIDDYNAGSISSLLGGAVVSLMGKNPGNSGSFSTFNSSGDIKVLVSTATHNESGAITTFHNSDRVVELSSSGIGTGNIYTFGNGTARTTLNTSGTDAGGLWLWNRNSYNDVILTSNDNISDQGGYFALNYQDHLKIQAYTTGNAGQMRTLGQGGQTGHWLAYAANDGNAAGLWLYNNGFIRNSINSSQRYGEIRTYGNNGLTNCLISSFNNDNYGCITVLDDNGIEQAGICIDPQKRGTVWGDVKNFSMADPDNSDQEIWYASLEGPEAAAYVRGTGRLVNGTNTIEFPDHFKHVADVSSMTVILTPLSATSKGLAVLDKTSSGFVVVELWNGDGTYEFDWEVKCVRAGFEDYEVYRPKAERRMNLGLPMDQSLVNEHIKPTSVSETHLTVPPAFNPRKDINEMKAPDQNQKNAIKK